MTYGKSCEDQRNSWGFLRPFLGNRCGPDALLFERGEPPMNESYSGMVKVTDKPQN